MEKIVVREMPRWRKLNSGIVPRHLNVVSWIGKYSLRRQGVRKEADVFQNAD